MRLTRLTPGGRGGVALLALEGPGATAWLASAFQRRAGAARALPAVGRVAVGRLGPPGGEAVDEVLLARADEHAYRLGCHGGPAVVAALEALLVRAGAFAGEAPALGPAGEEDRVRLEADTALPSARSELACEVLLRQRAGALADAVRALALAGRAEPEAASARVEALLRTAPLGRALCAAPAAAPRVALCGRPNAGKSSLFNALLGRTRALVVDLPGTTRDAVEEPAELAGLPVALIDTAGERDAVDALEAAGIARAHETWAAADLRLAVLDGALAGPDQEHALAAAAALPRPACLAINKDDLLDELARARWRAAAAERGLEACFVSARTGEGLDALARACAATLVGADPAALAAGPVVFTARQQGLLEGALRALRRGDPSRAATCLTAVAG